MGAEASELRAKGELAASARRLHFATHGLVSERRPAESALLLSASDEAEDGLLQVREILGLELAAETVVLSACRTGLGRRVDGEGFLGLTQAFYFAGARSAVVSLWAVSDRGTADLMRRFYQGLAEGRSASAALRSAQLALLETTTHASPYYWAPFVVAGSEPRSSP
jgi:CHAT domain-containing protein